MRSIQPVLSATAALVLFAQCRGAPQSVEKPAAKLAQANELVGGGVCREDNPVGVRLVRLAQSEVTAALEDALGREIVRAKDAPAFYLQGDHTAVADARPINSVDFASYKSAARTLASRYVAALPPETACTRKDSESACIHGPLKLLVGKLLRGLLPPEEWQGFSTLYRNLNAEFGPSSALEGVITSALLSPRFLYRTESGANPAQKTDTKLTQNEMLAFASFAIRGHAPNSDERDIALASSGTEFRPALGAIARQWTGTEAFTERFADFAEEWLGVSHLGDKLIRPSTEDNNGGDIGPAVLAEFKHFIRDNFLGPDGRFDRLFTATKSRMLPGLEHIYDGRFVPPDTILWDERQRKGVLGLAAVLAAHANANASDPVQRGMLIRLKILCEPMPPPVPNVDFSKVQTTPHMQTRERFETLAEAPSCRSCHTVINPPGYLFEHFDQYGRYRDIEKGRRINATGSIPPFFGQNPYPGMGDWEGITEMSEWLAHSPQARMCFARNLTNYLLSARVFEHVENCALQRIARRFMASGRLDDLVEDTITSDVFSARAGSANIPRDI
ncbi:MAG: DUF1588 domain-containing protein [Deltaproteobacteria bacterium]|nr:DUF1588 domain-containing protein [Deltaproteobacteria bacterium]